jgi:hypothetical protein
MVRLCPPPGTPTFDRKVTHRQGVGVLDLNHRVGSLTLHFPNDTAGAPRKVGAPAIYHFS